MSTSNPSEDAVNAPSLHNTTNMTDTAVELDDYDPSKFEVNGIKFKLDNFLPVSDARNGEDCRFKKRSICFVLKKPEHLRTKEDSFLYKCSACENMTHLNCYKSFMTENGFNHILSSRTQSMYVVCGKRCYQKKKKEVYSLRPSIVSTQTNQTTTKFWDNDAETSSLSILLEWITDERNADKYFGAQDTSSKSGFSIDDGITKAGLCKQISEIIKTTNGVYRSPDSIRSKIDDLVGKFKQTHDWIFATGQGVRETEGEENFKEIVLGKFRFYYDLEPILSQRPSIRPLFTTDDVDDGNDDDDDDLQLTLNDSQITFEDELSECMVTPKVPNKRNASSAKKSYSDAKKKIKSSIDSMTQFGQNEMMDSYLEQKKEHYQQKMNNEMKRMEVESERLRIEKEEKEKRMEVEAERLQIEKNRFLLEADVLKSQNSVTIGMNNMKILKMRAEASQMYPDMSKEEIEKMFPMYNSGNM